MFCRGCAARLPAFAATGPSPYATPPRAHRLLDLPGAWGWFTAVLLLGVALIALLSWVTLTPMWPGTGSPAPRPAAAAEAPRQVSQRADPRVGCEHLFFAFAARCEANHCAEAAYARHSRCDEVRAQRQRDEARRNLMSGY